MDEAARIRAPPTEGEEQQHLRIVVLCNMGACHWIMNSLDDADAAFRKVLEADPENVTARKSLAEVWHCIFKYELLFKLQLCVPDLNFMFE